MSLRTLFPKFLWFTSLVWLAPLFAENSVAGPPTAATVAAQPSPAAADPPAKLAAQGRLDLFADEAVKALDDGRVATGIGTLARMNWRPAAEQPRGYSIHCAATHIAWREFAVQFTPAGSGRVTLTLMGPWEQVSPGVLSRQEVQWDSLSADGGQLAGGDFETLDAAGRPVHWTANGGRIVSATDAAPAADGRRFAQTWHNATLSTTLQVTAGRPVTLRLRVRAAVPDGFVEMARIPGRDTPAHLAAQRFRRGANLGNYLEAPRGQNWGARYDKSDFERIRAAGFDHVRLPIGWHNYTGPAPDFKLEPAIFDKADFLVQQARQHGLAAIVNIHHFDDFTSNPEQQRPRLLAVWRQLAEHYADAPPTVAFELLNEPKDAATTETLNPIYAEAIRVIRQTNPQRTIFIGPGRWNQVSELPKLRLPGDEKNVIVTVHCYEPFYFTHQGATWTGDDTKVTGIRFPGPPATPLAIPAGLAVKDYVRDWIDRYNREPAESNPSSPRVIRDTVRLAAEWSDYYGRPIHFGEFGAYIQADAASRASYYREFRQALDDAGIGWAIWDWKAGFRYWDEPTNQPAPGMREALFPKP